MIGSLAAATAILYRFLHNADVIAITDKKLQDEGPWREDTKRNGRYARG